MGGVQWGRPIITDQVGFLKKKKKIEDQDLCMHFGHSLLILEYILDAATSSGILKAKQKLGRTFNSDKLGGFAFTKISKRTMCSA